MQVPIFDCAYHRIADAACLATTLHRRDASIALGLMDQLHTLVSAQYDRMIGLELGNVAVDGCITKTPCGGEMAGRSPVDRGKQGLKRSTVVDACGIPLGSNAAPAKQHDSPLPEPTLDTLGRLCPLPDAVMVKLDRGYDSGRTRQRLAGCGFCADIAPPGEPAPIAASYRRRVERTNAWTHTYKKLVWCTERRGAVIDFWLAFAAVIIIVRWLVRES